MLDAADKDVLKQVQRRAVNKISGLSGRTYVDKLKELELEQKNLYRHAANILSMVLMDVSSADTWIDLVRVGVHRLALLRST